MSRAAMVTGGKSGQEGEGGEGGSLVTESSSRDSRHERPDRKPGGTVIFHSLHGKISAIAGVHDDGKHDDLSLFFTCREYISCDNM